MNYTKLDYFIYKLSLFFSNQYFNYLILLILILGFIIFAFYDFKNDGPVFSSNKSNKEENNNSQMRHFNEHKFSLRKEIIIGVIPIVLIVFLFGTKRVIMHYAENPDTIISYNKNKTVYTGNVVFINYKKQEVGISNKNDVDTSNMNDVIVGEVDNSPASLYGNVSPYSGTTMSLEMFAKLKDGDKVKIVCPSYKFKYKNHDEYSSTSSKESDQQLKLIKSLKINGTVKKISDNKTKNDDNKKALPTEYSQSYY